MKISDILNKKKLGKKITMLTAYDYPFASLVDKAGIDIVLIGDSLANVVLGLDSTLDVGIDEMIYHSKAVRRGVKNALLVGDMPFSAYQEDIKLALGNAKRFIKEGGCDAVKIEWFDKCVAVIKELIESGIDIVGHIGLTPQTAEKLGGFKVQGKDSGSAEQLIEQAKKLEDLGCFCLVLECMPNQIAKLISESISIPTIGIGAGVYCDGQVLVMHDVLGLYDKKRPKFVKQYLNCSDLIVEAVGRYKNEVVSGVFPGDEHSYHISDEELKKTKK